MARLSALAMSEEEEPEAKRQLEETLEFVNKLGDLDTSGVEPTSHVHGVVNAFRQDVTCTSFSLDKVKLNAPDFVSAGFRVPRIIG